MTSQNDGNPITLSLNDLLDYLEAQLGRVGQGISINPEKVLLGLDEASRRIAKSKEDGRDVRVEVAQFDYIQKVIRNNKRAFLRSIGGKQGLFTLRDRYQPSRENTWWYVDEGIEADMKQAVKRWLVASAIGMVVIVIAVIAYRLFLAPSPEELAKMEAVNQSQNLIESQDFRGALTAVDAALALTPDDVDLIILKGVLLEKIGEQNGAKSQFQRAESQFKSLEEFLLSRAMSYLQIGEAEKSLADSQAVLAENPDSAQGLYFSGRAMEMLGDYQGAINAYNTGSELALAQGNPQLAGTIKVNLAMLMQSIPIDIPSPDETPIE